MMREAISDHQWHSPGARIDEARGDLHLEGVIQTRLVACNASVDALGRARLCLIKQERICEEGARHRDEICISVGQNLLGDLGRIDAVRRHERNLHPVGILAQLPCHPTDEGCNQSQSACSFLVTQLMREAINRNQHALSLVTQLMREAINRNQHAISRSYWLPRHPTETATWHAGSSEVIRLHQG